MFPDSNAAQFNRAWRNYQVIDSYLLVVSGLFVMRVNLDFPDEKVEGVERGDNEYLYGWYCFQYGGGKVYYYLLEQILHQRKELCDRIKGDTTAPFMVV